MPLLTSRFRSLIIVAVISPAMFALAGCSRPEPNQWYQYVSTPIRPSDKLAEPFGIAVKDGVIYFSDGNSGKIFRFSEAGGIEEFAMGLDTPSGVAFSPDGNLLVADTGSHSIISIDESGGLQTIAGVSNSSGLTDGPTSAAQFNGPIGIAVAADGIIFVADTYNDRIRVIDNGTVSTLAGGTKGFADGVGSAAMFDTPLGIALWQEDRLLVADSGNRRIRVVEPDGSVWTLAGNGDYGIVDNFPGLSSFAAPTAIALSPNGVIYIADGNSIRAIGRRVLPFVESISDRRRGLSDGISARARFNRPSGLAVAPNGELLVADSDNGVIRSLSDKESPQMLTRNEIESLRFNAAEFRQLQPGRWPYDPPDRVREIAGTLGEIRGEIVEPGDQAWFHNGLDIPGGYGEKARFIRTEKTLNPSSIENFGTSRELIRLPTVGYVHIRIGRDSSGKPYDDPRFLHFSENGKPAGVRLRRGTRFRAGEAIGTLNSMNHVHLIAGRPGAEMNALDALVLPGISDSIDPTIEEVKFFDEAWQPIETRSASGRIIIDQRARVVVRSYDRKDGNAERRRLAPYKIGYTIAKAGEDVNPPENWNISFERMPAERAVNYVYAPGSRSGATGVTVFNFIASNFVDGDNYFERFLEPAGLEPGEYSLRVWVKDFFGNTSNLESLIEVTK
jgi:DNA-binding beta-propeller fold protein YncE